MILTEDWGRRSGYTGKRIPVDTVQHIISLLQQGHSATYVSRWTGTSLQSVGEYRAVLFKHEPIPLCRCGRNSYLGHHGFRCGWRKQGESTDQPASVPDFEYVKEPRTVHSKILAGITPFSSVRFPIQRRG